MKILLANLTKMVNDSGGLAKVTCAFANEMKRRGHDVSLVYSDVRTGSFYFPFRDDIPAYDLSNYKGKHISFPFYMRLERELLRVFDKRKARRINNIFAEKYLLNNLQDVLQVTRPEIIVSFQPAASKLLLCDLHTSIPVITMSHGDPEDYFHTYPVEEIPALEKSTVCQVLLPSFAQHIKKHLANAKTVVIGNSVPQYDIQADLKSQKINYKILFIGRLVKSHKRPHLLIEAFSKLASDFPNWRVELWGAEHGKAYYKELEILIKKYHLENQVFLKGITNDVKSVLQQGDIYAFPSAYEGFGLSLGEAMSMGLPAIGYKNCSAVNELIQDGINGFLCDDGVDDFADKLKTLMENQDLRVQMGQAARESMKQYSPEVIWNAWEQLIYQVSFK